MRYSKYDESEDFEEEEINELKMIIKKDNYNLERNTNLVTSGYSLANSAARNLNNLKKQFKFSNESLVGLESKILDVNFKESNYDYSNLQGN